jgi:hypothetical protein
MSRKELKKRKSSTTTPPTYGACAIFSTFLFARFKAKLSKCESYSHVLVYLQIPCFGIIRFIFASKKFDLMQNKNMLKQILDSERIFASTFHTGEYFLQDIRFEANICKPSSEFHIKSNNCLQKKYLHTGEY